jgi:hypothetical protein
MTPTPEQNMAEFISLLGRLVEAVSEEQRPAVLHSVGRLLDQTEGDLLEEWWTLPAVGRTP